MRAIFSSYAALAASRFGGAGDDEAEIDLIPFANNNRLMHLSIVASNRSSTARSCIRPAIVTVPAIFASSYLSSPSSLRAAMRAPGASSSPIDAGYFLIYAALAASRFGGAEDDEAEIDL